jgi:Trypsin-like peptidase domain
MGNGILETEILPGCSARIDIDGVPCGTGFFVTTKDLVTCKHVIDNATEIEISDRFGNKYPVSEAPVVGDNFDLAWIKLETADTKVPVALLGTTADIGDKLYSFGYPEDNPGESATFEIEGPTGDTPPRIKFKAGQVKPGMSGSPLLNMRTGAVCAILISTRGRQSSLGGYGVPVSTMLSSPSFRELGSLNASVHDTDPRWMNALTANQKDFSTREDALQPDHDIAITQVTGNARVGKIVNIGDVSGPVIF